MKVSVTSGIHIFIIDEGVRPFVSERAYFSPVRPQYFNLLGQGTKI
jgi:hypothetical protein